MREQSIINASVPEQLAAIANWHDSENPSRMALGAIASCALDYIQKLEAALKRANTQAEHFEREWYLCRDELEKPCKGCGQ